MKAGLGCGSERKASTPVPDHDAGLDGSLRDYLRKLKQDDPQGYIDFRKRNNLPPDPTLPATANTSPSSEPTAPTTITSVPQSPDTTPSPAGSPSPDSSPLPSVDLTGPSSDPAPSPDAPAPDPTRPRFAVPGPPPRLIPESELPQVWCTIERTVTVIPGVSAKQTSVARCDDVPGLGSDWTIVDRNLTFPDANRRSNNSNTANQPPVWCVLQRLEPGQATPQRTVVRCDNVAGVGPGWTPINNNLPWTEAIQIAFGTPPSMPPGPGQRRPPPPQTAMAPPASVPAPMPPVNLPPPQLASAPPQPMPPTAVGPSTPPPGLMPPTAVNTPAAPGDCPPGSRQYTCSMIRNVGTGGALIGRHICVPPKGYGAATCFTDVVMPGTMTATNHTACSPSLLPKNYADMAKQCKADRGTLSDMTPATATAYQRVQEPQKKVQREKPPRTYVNRSEPQRPANTHSTAASAAVIGIIGVGIGLANRPRMGPSPGGHTAPAPRRYH